jgi:hypothetical protein
MKFLEWYPTLMHLKKRPPPFARQIEHALKFVRGSTVYGPKGFLRRPPGFAVHVDLLRCTPVCHEQEELISGRIERPMVHIYADQERYRD